MPAAPRDRGAGRDRGGDVLAQGELRPVVEAGDIGAGGDSGDAADDLADGEVRDVARGERDGVAVRDDRERRGGGGGRLDDEVAFDLDVGRGRPRVEAHGRASEEVRRAAGARAPDRVGERGQVERELGDVGGEGRRGVRGGGAPLAGAGAEGSAEGAVGLERAPPILEGEVGRGRQGVAVVGDERAARDARGAGIGVGLVAEDPPCVVAAAIDAQLAEQVGAVGQQQVDAIVAGAVAGEGQGARADETVAEGDRARVREDDRGVVLVAALGIVTVAAVGFDAGVAEQREETVGAHAGGLGRLVDVDHAVVISGRRRTGVEEAAATQQDERARVRAGVRRVARAEAAGLTDVGERGDRQRAAVDDGGAGVGVEAGQRLDAAAGLDDGQLAGAVGEDRR